MDTQGKSNPIVVVGRDGVQTARRCAEIALIGRCAVHCEDLVEALTSVRRDKAAMALVIPPAGDVPAIDLPRLFREASPFAYLPVLVQLPRNEPAERCRFLNAGADEVFGADTGCDELEARVLALLRVKDVHDQLAASRQALQRMLDAQRRLLAKLKKDNANLQTLCTTDPLTRVQNVRSFWDILEHEFAIARRYGQPLSLLMLDIDHFKLVNDLNGHPAGDFVLKELAVILKRSVREADVVARIGGEEFAIVLPRTDPRRCAVLAERIRRETAAKQFAAYGKLIYVTVSIGSSTYPADAEVTEPRLLAYLADQALLTAKEAGRDRVVAYHSLPAETRRRLVRQFRQERQATVADAPAQT